MATTMSRVDAAFRKIKPNVPAFRVWRIEGQELVEVPRQHWGQFYDGDCYLVYAAFEQGQHVCLTTKSAGEPSRFRVEHHVHFWLGLHCGQSEATVAVLKTVELDELINGVGVQHREVQANESPRFRAYFEHHKGIRYLRGDVSTVDVFPKLFLVQGKRALMATQLESVQWRAMNDGDAFVIVNNEHVFVWNGAKANRMEKMQATKFAEMVAEEMGIEEVVVVDQGQERNMDKDVLSIFSSLLPLDQISELQNSVWEQKEALEVSAVLKLYVCSDESDGTLRVAEQKSGPLTRSELNSSQAFIVDNGNNGVWVWVGRRAESKARSEALRNAQGFIKKKGYNAFTHVARVTENNEPHEFRALFKNWRDKNDNATLARSSSMSRGAFPVVQTRFDAETLHTLPSLASSSGMVDDGSGALEVFRVHNSDLVTIEDNREGIFYDSECYVVLYAYNAEARDNYMIYIWQGSKSAQEVRNAGRIAALELDERLGGKQVIVLVSQGSEPPHFLALFKGEMRVMQGKHDQAEKIENLMLQVHGRSELTTKSTQVNLSSSSLKSGDCFVLLSNDSAYVWMGKSSTGDEREMAKRVASSLCAEFELVFEGHENDGFWNALPKDNFDDKACNGNKESNGKDVEQAQAPRLFHFYNNKGSFKKEEVIDFVQSDLVVEDLMLLDAWHTLFIWVGKYCKQSGITCFDLANFYLETEITERNVDTPLIVVKQGHEPPHFKGFFNTWKDNLLDIELPAEMQDTVDSSSEAVHKNGFEFSDVDQFYSLYELSNNKGLGEKVNLTRKEMYLSEHDFASVFGMDKESFVELPKWRQDGLKRSVGLF